MKVEDARDAEKPRDRPRAPEESYHGPDPDYQIGKEENDWSESGTEDPAFYIKLAEEE